MLAVRIASLMILAELGVSENSLVGTNVRLEDERVQIDSSPARVRQHRCVLSHAQVTSPAEKLIEHRVGGGSTAIYKRVTVYRDGVASVLGPMRSVEPHSRAIELEGYRGTSDAGRMESRTGVVCSVRVTERSVQPCRRVGN